MKIISGIKTKVRVILLASSTSKLSLLGHAGLKIFPRGRLFGVTFLFLCLSLLGGLAACPPVVWCLKTGAPLRCRVTAPLSAPQGSWHTAKQKPKLTPQISAVASLFSPSGLSRQPLTFISSGLPVGCREDLEGPASTPS